MIASIFSRLSLVALLGLAGCATTETEATAPPPTNAAGWLMSSGKEPTKAEFAALAATCEMKGGAVDACLTHLGLKRAP